MFDELYLRLMTVSQQFTDIVKEETKLLTDHNVAAAQGLLSKKQQLAEAHQTACQEFTAVNGTAQCNMEQLQALKDTIDVMHTSLIENKEALDVAQTVRSGLLDRISKSVKETQAPTCHYNKSARFNANTVPVSMLALNRQI